MPDLPKMRVGDLLHSLPTKNADRLRLLCLFIVIVALFT